MDLAVWRDISLMWLILLTLVAVLPFSILFFFAVRGMHRLRQVVKQYLPLAQEKARLVADKTEEVSIKVAGPFIDAQAKASQAGRMTKVILRRKNG